MTPRRRPAAALFTALLVWLTAVSSVRGALPRQPRLLDVDGSGVATLSVTIPRPGVAALRPSARSLTPPLLLAFLPPAEASANTPRAPRHETVPLASVRLLHGTARTYDATAPPRRTR